MRVSDLKVGDRIAFVYVKDNGERSQRSGEVVELGANWVKVQTPQGYRTFNFGGIQNLRGE